MAPSREIFWNVVWPEIIYILAALAVGLMVYAFVRRYKMWHVGGTDNRMKGCLRQRWSVFIKTAIIDGLLHRKFIGVCENNGRRPYRIQDMIPREFIPGTAHFLVAIGCIMLLIGTAADVISHYIYDFIQGAVYFAHSLLADVGGIMILIGVIIFIVRRYGIKPSRLDNKFGDLMAILAIVIIVLTGFVVEGFRIAADELAQNPSWSAWSPGGLLLAKWFAGLDESALIFWHRNIWWIHALITLGFLVYIAWYFNRLWHIILSPLNVFWRNLGTRGKMETIDLETAQSYGVSRVEGFSWKHLLDLDACTRCGRCSDVCPANLSGKPLNPRMIMQNLKSDWEKKAPALLSAAKKKKDVTGSESRASTPAAEDNPMIGGIIDPEAVWNCTTCFACQEVCPVWAEPMIKISEMRRSLVLEQAVIPETAEGALRSIEDRGHPWRGTMLTRESWYEGLGIKTLSEDADVDILFWVGCTEALEDRSVKVAQAAAKLMKTAGIKFGILGSEESCCGDPARRLGNEYLYQMQAQRNIEVLNNYNVKKIVTACPHCYNTIKNEYPEFGGNFEVIHHTEFILGLFKEEKLKISRGPRGKVTYHDPCYLGRYNSVFEAARQLLGYVPDLSIVEMARNRERAFCCGAGGGHMWLEEQKAGDRINVMRTQQALRTGADIVCTACPYCLQMFQDGAKTREVDEKLRILDVAEILAEGVIYHPEPADNCE